tara:strand:- start:506 stop:718 length:213 start_codon:yes stop_codon:yes gene_type:complete
MEQTEQYRKIIIAQADNIELLKDNIKDLQGQLQKSYIRIKELREELDSLERKLQDLLLESSREINHMENI